MSTDVIGPILLQRQCDGGKGDMSPEEWAKVVAERLQGNPPFHSGCGTKFRWWWGSGAYCPTCGRLYVTDMAELKRYRLEPPHEQQDYKDNQQDSA